MSAGPPGNDGTNACSFLAMKIADVVLNASIADAFSPLLPEIAEEVIWQLPFSINSQRDVTHLYDAQETYQLLNRLGLLQSEYDLSEELSSVPAFSTAGRQELARATTKLCASGDFLSLYTCSPYIFIVGSLGGYPFLLDTHPISESLGGKGSGLLKVYADSTCEALSHWIFGRLLGKVAVDEKQSLAILYPRVPPRLVNLHL